MTTGEIPGMNPPAKLRALVVDDAAVMRRRHNNGSTRSLVIMVASATLATMTIPVAAA